MHHLFFLFIFYLGGVWFLLNYGDFYLPIFTWPDFERLLILFVAANEAFERAASVGLLPNMILYLTRDYGMPTPTAANFLFLWSAATNFMPILGAFLADSCLGRYRMIGFGSIASFLVNFFPSDFISSELSYAILCKKKGG